MRLLPKERGLPAPTKYGKMIWSGTLPLPKPSLEGIEPLQRNAAHLGDYCCFRCLPSFMPNCHSQCHLMGLSGPKNRVPQNPAVHHHHHHHQHHHHHHHQHHHHHHHHHRCHRFPHWNNGHKINTNSWVLDSLRCQQHPAWLSSIEKNTCEGITCIAGLT